MSTWVVIGGHGMLGTDLADMLRDRGHEVRIADLPDCDITNVESVRRSTTGADVVVNCAAYTKVDDAESNEALAFAINAVGARNAAMTARESGARFVHISTDYVFDGESAEPYGENDPQNPRSAYGRTKAAGEWAVRTENPDALIVRTAWLYGEHGPNFVKTMLRLAETHETVSVVDDQKGQPTWTRSLAEFVIALIDAQSPGGYYHGTSEGAATWFDFTREIFGISGLDPKRVLPTTTEAFPRPAPRPANSVLRHSGGPAVPGWQEAIRGYLRGASPQ